MRAEPRFAVWTLQSVQEIWSISAKEITAGLGGVSSRETIHALRGGSVSGHAQVEWAICEALAGVPTTEKRALKDALQRVLHNLSAGAVG